MTRISVARGLVTAVAATLVLALTAGPAFAQNGTLKGKVIDDQGRAVNMATVAFEQAGGTKKTNTITDKDGLWVKPGLSAGAWNMKVYKDKLNGKEDNVMVVAGKDTALPDFMISETGGALRKPPAGGAAAAPALNKEEADKANAENEALQKMMKEANAAIAAGQNDVAIEKITALTVKMPKCASCFSSLGDVYVKLDKMEDAEKAYLKSIELDDKQAQPYNALSNIYNSQRKFDEAVKMSQKAGELSGGGATGGDFKSVYNQGVILWNANKFADALAQFKRATELDPAHADAQYFYGMCLLNQNKLKEAKAPFLEYIKIAPTGPHAAEVKEILKAIG